MLETATKGAAAVSAVVGALMLVATPSTGEQGTIGLIAAGIGILLLVQSVYGFFLLRG